MILKGKEHLDTLILQDYIDSSLNQGQNKKNKSTMNKEGSGDKKNPRSTSHVLDLRKQYLIQKYKLDTFESPVQRTSISNRLFFKKTKFHVPKKTVKKRRTNEHGVIKKQKGLSFSPQPIYAFMIILFLIVSPLYGLPIYSNLFAKAQNIISKSSDAVSLLNTGLNNLAGREFIDAQSDLSEARDSFIDLHNSINNFSGVTRELISVTPVIGSKYDFVNNMTQVGYLSAEIGRLLSSSLAPDQSQEKLSDILKKIRIHTKEITLLLIQSKDEIKQLDPHKLPDEYADHVQFLKNNIDLIIANAEKIDRVLELSYDMLGGDALKRYLILFQNNRELRPTGGFMGSVSLVDFAKGDLVSLEFPGGGTYDLEGAFTRSIIPPDPIRIVNDEWNIWDANWWADFPTSAEKIKWFYENSEGPTIDGVIAINSDFMLPILEAYGPFTLDSFGLVVNNLNFYDTIQTQVELNYDKEENKPKQVLKDLLPLVLDKMLHSSDVRTLLGIITQGLLSDNIQIYSTNPDSEQDIKDLGWDGSLKKTKGDYLSVISTNIAGGKSDESIYETIDHQAVIQQNGDIISTVTVKKEHRGDPNDIFAYVNNVDYLRFYVPRGSILIRAQGFKKPNPSLFRQIKDGQEVDTYLDSIETKKIETAFGVTAYEESGKTVFADWMQVEPGSTAEVSITYKLPFVIYVQDPSSLNLVDTFLPSYHEFDSYSLLVQKQSGKKNVIFNSSIALSDGHTVLWDTSLGSNSTGFSYGLYTYSADFTSDLYYAFLIGSDPATTDS